MENQELIWVDKEFAERYKVLIADKTKREEQIQVFNEYLEKIKESSKQEFKANLENLEEDVAVYTGLMLKVKQAFGKAKDEQMTASYALWEKFEKEIPSINKKIDNIITALTPLQQKLETINQLCEKIKTWDIDQLIKSIRGITDLYGTNKKMVEFLVNNFKLKKENKL